MNAWSNLIGWRNINHVKMFVPSSGTKASRAYNIVSRIRNLQIGHFGGSCRVFSYEYLISMTIIYSRPIIWVLWFRKMILRKHIVGQKEPIKKWKRYLHRISGNWPLEVCIYIPSIDCDICIQLVVLSAVDSNIFVELPVPSWIVLAAEHKYYIRKQ